MVLSQNKPFLPQVSSAVCFATLMCTHHLHTQDRQSPPWYLLHRVPPSSWHCGCGAHIPWHYTNHMPVRPSSHLFATQLPLSQHSPTKGPLGLPILAVLAGLLCLPNSIVTGYLEGPDKARSISEEDCTPGPPLGRSLGVLTLHF